MADNGKIIRNGAEIQIDENGNVVARPAEGQEFIVEDDARVGTLEADNLTTEQISITTGTGVAVVGNDSELSDAISDSNIDAYIVTGGLSDDHIIEGDILFLNDKSGDEQVTGDLTYNNVRGTVTNIILGSEGSLTVNSSQCVVHGGWASSTADVTITANNVVYNGVYGGSVTFESGTSGGIVDGCSNTSVTDNGDNTVGDIA